VEVSVGLASAPVARCWIARTGGHRARSVSRRATPPDLGQTCPRGQGLAHFVHPLLEPPYVVLRARRELPLLGAELQNLSQRHAGLLFVAHTAPTRPGEPICQVRPWASHWPRACNERCQDETRYQPPVCVMG